MARCASCDEPGIGDMAQHQCGSNERLMRYFEFGHLPVKLQHVSRHFYTVADLVRNTVPDGPEKTVCLRKLLEAKDCAVRAALDLPDVS
jgi:hypothetical protein